MLGEVLMTARRLIRLEKAPKLKSHQVSHSEEVPASQGFTVEQSTPAESSTSHAAAAMNPTQGFDPHHDPNNENLRPHSPSMDRH